MNLINALPNWSDLIFEESTHTYTVNGVGMPSVSGLIKRFHEPFPDKASENVAKKLTRETGNLWTQQMVKDMWKAEADRACVNGSRDHAYGEEYSLTYPNLREPENIKQQGIKLFYENLPKIFKVVSLEQRMYSKKFGYAGTADIIILDTVSNLYWIMDWKTNKDLNKTYQKKLLVPFETIEECPMTEYYIQLSFYQMLLEEAGYKVGGRAIIWLKRMYSQYYQVFTCPDLSPQLEEVYKQVA